MATIPIRPSAGDDLSGRRIADRYSAIEIVGRGGLGTVYRAIDERLGRTVALKVLLRRFSDDPRFGAMLRDEAQVTARLNHPGVVRAYDWGEASGFVYMVTEYVAGRSLKQILSVCQPIPLEYTTRIVREIAEALRYAHSQSVVHLDVKPSNILIADDGRILLSDFGLAIAAGQSGADRGFIAGTLAYMSPEQAAGKQLDLRSDVYSLGVVLYELVAGARPFAHAPTRFDRKLRNAALMRVVRPLTARIPEPLAQLVMIALSEEPGGRYSSMDTFLERLDATVGPSAALTTPKIILESCAIATPSDDTAVYDSERVPAHEPVFASYRVIDIHPDANGHAPGTERSAELPLSAAAAEPARLIEAHTVDHDPVIAIPSSIPSPDFAIRELQVLRPDGRSSLIPLEGERISLGRSNVADLSFPEDAGLSRQHLAFERDGGGWVLHDLGSRNGTLLNGSRITGPVALKSGDSILAGRLILVCQGLPSQASKAVVVFDPGDGAEGSSSVITNFEGITLGKPIADAQNFAAAQTAALVRAGNELAGNRPLPELFRFILDLAIQAVKADRGVLMTLENGELIVRANQGAEFRISTAVRDRVLNSGNSVLVRDTSIGDAFRGQASIVEQNIRTLMAVPLQTRSEIIGIIYVDSPSLLREFTKDDLSLLTVMANVAAIRIEQTRFAELEQARQLMDRDLAQAAEIQQAFLPSVAPAVRGLDLAGRNVPCRTCGGDYYDFFPYGDNRIAMVLGEVSGKGMPASLLMTGLQARVQVLIEEPASLAEVMTRLNRITSANCPANRFISLFLCSLDGDTGELAFCNAGQVPPLIVRADGSYEQLKGGGPVLGILAQIEYEEYHSKLEIGDTLVIYSDGVTEANNPNGEEFEGDRLANTVSGNRDRSASAIVDELNQAVAAFAAGAPQADDLTLIVARRV